MALYIGSLSIKTLQHAAALKPKYTPPMNALKIYFALPVLLMISTVHTSTSQQILLFKSLIMPMHASAGINQLQLRDFDINLYAIMLYANLLLTKLYLFIILMENSILLIYLQKKSNTINTLLPCAIILLVLHQVPF